MSYGEIHQMREVWLRAARAVGGPIYASAKTSRLGRLTSIGLVQDIRRALVPPMSMDDVLEVLAALDGAGAQYWLAGGWGVDALVGKQTREHRDLDLILNRRDLGPALAALAAHGFRHVPAVADGTHRYIPGAFMADRELLQDGGRRIIDLHPVDLATWPAVAAVPDLFAEGRLGNRTVGCLSVQGQRAAHEGYELTEAHVGDLLALDSLSTPAS